MKNLIKICTSLIIVSVLLSSCNQKLGLIKRHYSKGYYVESNNHNTKTPKEKTTPSTVIAQKVNTSELTSNPKATTVPAKEETCVKKPTSYTSTKVLSEKTTVHVITQKKQHVNPIHFKNNSIKASKSNESVFEKQQTIASSHDDDDGLSLFWILILVILILWALGFAFLLGPFIHILLLVALILFILWLFHIV